MELTMNEKELDRIQVLRNVLDKRISQQKAADVLKLSPRHVRRLIHRLLVEGPGGLISRKRGKRSNRAISEDVKAQAFAVIELSNKFGKAVFFANSQEFRVGSTEEQMLIVACRIFIQNCIILWNYLYLSQVLINQNIEDRETLLQTIKSGSVISWRHINLHGEYDFTAANDRGLGIVLELDKIKRLKIDQPVQ